MILLLLFSPAALAAPRTMAQWSANPVRPGSPFALEVIARWDGEAGRYVIGVPRVEFPEGIRKQSVSSRSRREGEENVVRTRWELVAEKKGDFPPLAVTLQVFAAGEKDPSEVKIETEPLLVDAARWRGIPLCPLLPGLMVALLAICGVAWLLQRRRSGLPRQDESPTGRPAAEMDRLRDELHASRVRGDTPAFLDTARRMLTLASPSEVPEGREVASLLEQARYGSLRLSGEEMEGWCRQLKRLCPTPAGTEPDSGG